MGAEGINTVGGSVIQCSVSNCNEGIQAEVVTQSTADSCWKTAIEAASVVSNSRGHSLSGSGIVAKTVTGCEGIGKASGIYATTVSDSTGEASSNSGASYGIYCDNANNSNGTGSTHGIYAEQNVKGCTGKTTRALYIPLFKQYGIYCQNAIASSGESYADAYSTGIYASGNVSDCTGKANFIASSTTADSVGIECSNASNSNGTGRSFGIRAFANAANCYGKNSLSIGGAGIGVDGTASFCRGDSEDRMGSAIFADIAIGCTRAQGFIISSNKLLGTPAGY
jgi:hypothetical protein